MNTKKYNYVYNLSISTCAISIPKKFSKLQLRKDQRQIKVLDKTKEKTGKVGTRGRLDCPRALAFDELKTMIHCAQDDTN